jgi:hypothetical protein
MRLLEKKKKKKIKNEKEIRIEMEKKKVRGQSIKGSYIKNRYVEV